MERTRVPKGKKYWYLDDRLFILECIETGSPIDDARAEVGNYFHSPHKLSDMSFKIEKVLKGADVIEMPSEQEIRKHYAEMMINNPDYHLRTSADVHINVVDYLKSKIMK